MTKPKTTKAEEAIESAKTIGELVTAVVELKPEQKNPLGGLIYRRMEQIVGEAVDR